MALLRKLKNRWGKHPDIEVVFFDVGGTLVYSNLHYLDLLHQALLVIGYKITRAQVARANDLARQAVARRRRRLFNRLDPNTASRMWLDNIAESLKLDLQGMDLSTALTAAIRKVEAERDVYVDPEALEVLEVLKARRFGLGVISNWAADLPEYLARMGLAKYFDAIIASEAVGSSKPHREIFLRALAALDCDPAHSVHIGDDYWADIVGARELGIHPVLLDRDGEALRSDCPTITRFPQLLDLLKQK